VKGPPTFPGPLNPAGQEGTPDRSHAKPPGKKSEKTREEAP